MAYDHAVNGAVLVVINDGSGAQCGMEYGYRCAVARHEPEAARLALWRIAARKAARANGDRLNAAQAQRAAVELDDYYSRHIAELA